MSHDHDHDEPSLDDLWALTSEDNPLEERADALMTIALRLKQEKELWGAIAAAQSAMDLYEKVKDETNVGRVLLELGKTYGQLGEFHDARESFARASSCFQSVADDSNRGDALRYLANVYDDLSQPNEASLVRKDAISILASSQNFTPAGIAALDLGESQGRAGQQAEALESFNLAFKYFQDANDLTGVVRAHDRIAAALIDLGNFNEAIGHLREALALAEYIEDRPRTSWGRYRLGWTLVTIGNHDEAFPLLDQAILDYKSVGDFKSAAECDLQRAHALNAEGNHEDALKIYRTVHAVFVGLGQTSDALMTKVNMGENLASGGNLLQAQQVFSEALAEIGSSDSWLERATRIRLAEVQLGLNNFSGALEAIETSDASAWGDDVFQKARHLNAQANALILAGRAPEAVDLLKQVIEMNVNQSLPKETARAYELMVETLSGASEVEKTHITAQAIALYLAAGFVDEARDLSRKFMPTDNTQAVQMLRREFGQPNLFEESLTEE